MRRLFLLVTILLALPATAARAGWGTPTDDLAARATAVQPGARVVAIALGERGIPYRWGGTSPATGFDCSGLVHWVYARLGVDLPRTSYGQFDVGRRVMRADLQPGDLVFSNGTGHVGIYIG